MPFTRFAIRRITSNVASTSPKKSAACCSRRRLSKCHSIWVAARPPTVASSAPSVIAQTALKLERKSKLSGSSFMRQPLERRLSDLKEKEEKWGGLLLPGALPETALV